jgi:hypothetical protein
LISNGTWRRHPVKDRQRYHFYNLPGTYNASLVITSLGGCRDSVAKTMVVRGPQGDFSYEKTTGCTPSVYLSGPLRRIRYPLSGISTMALQRPRTIQSSIIFIHPRQIRPRLILVDPQGCKVPIIGRDTISVFGVEAGFLRHSRLFVIQAL